MYSQKIAGCIILQLPIITFKKLTLSNMHHRKTYMHINFQETQVSTSVKIVHTNIFGKNCKLHKFSTCNYNFEKSRHSDMNYPLMDIQADFKINRHVIYQISAKRNTDGRTDRRHDRWHDGQT